VALIMGISTASSRDLNYRESNAFVSALINLIAAGSALVFSKNPRMAS